ncbi:HdeD family acid-resistance protein [Actinomycetospora chiangmaiensis]|uniref:HdeD family acid-resistance protein n=1 Tax=Actinomycetospora chiangmaiensis TaxID=402650 RepID=UPI000371D933|nr:DUF308 domain-containing protein [Actinomycetospora chiangmaiensis]
MTSSIDLRQVSARWGWILADGILGVIVGLIALIFPIATVLVLAVFLGIGLLISGIIEATVALRVQHGAPGRWWVAIFGVITALAGILVIFFPGTGVTIMVVGLLLWFLFVGINDLFVAARSKEHRGWNIGMGVLALLAAVILLFSPGAAVGTIALLAGFGFLLRGASEIGLALSLRRASR